MEISNCGNRRKCRLPALSPFLTMFSNKLPLRALNPFPDDTFQTLLNSKILQKFDDNGRKFLKRIENTVGKEEIAHSEKFLLFPQCFQETSTADK